GAAAPIPGHRRYPAAHRRGAAAAGRLQRFLQPHLSSGLPAPARSAGRRHGAVPARGRLGADGGGAAARRGPRLPRPRGRPRPGGRAVVDELAGDHRAAFHLLLADGLDGRRARGGGAALRRAAQRFDARGHPERDDALLPGRRSAGVHLGPRAAGADADPGLRGGRPDAGPGGGGRRRRSPRRGPAAGEPRLPGGAAGLRAVVRHSRPGGGLRLAFAGGAAGRQADPRRRPGGGVPGAGPAPRPVGITAGVPAGVLAGADAMTDPVPPYQGPMPIVPLLDEGLRLTRAHIRAIFLPVALPVAVFATLAGVAQAFSMQSLFKGGTPSPTAFWTPQVLLVAALLGLLPRWPTSPAR